MMLPADLLQAWLSADFKRLQYHLPQLISEVGAMKSSPKLLAAITASGAILSLGVSAQAHQKSNQSEVILGSESTPLSARVEQLRTKLRHASPVFYEGSTEGRIDNIVQFFNFRNR
jgi:hypothetical protein